MVIIELQIGGLRLIRVEMGKELINRKIQLIITRYKDTGLITVNGDIVELYRG